MTITLSESLIHYLNEAEQLEPDLYLITKKVDGKVVESFFAGEPLLHPTYKYQFIREEPYQDINFDIYKYWKMTEGAHKVALSWAPEFKDDLYCWIASNNLIKKFGKEEPLSPIYSLNYIQGAIDNKNFDLESLYTYLKFHPEVLYLEKEDIPYYNSSEDRDRSLRIKVRLAQEKIDELYHYYKKDEFWSVRIKDALSPAIQTKWDPLGIRQFLNQYRD